MTLMELREHLAREVPRTSDPDADAERRYELAAELGFTVLEVLRSRLAEYWEARR